MKKWTAIIKKLDGYMKQSDKIDEAHKKFFKVVYPTSYTPYPEYSQVSAYIEGVARGNFEIADWLDYYAYEATLMYGSAVVKDDNGIEYDFKKKKDVIRFFSKNYPL